MATLGTIEISDELEPSKRITYTVPSNEALPLPKLVVSISGNWFVKEAPVKRPDIIPWSYPKLENRR
jgi:hypothetical protein